jgi:hypothetical protein
MSGRDDEQAREVVEGMLRATPEPHDFSVVERRGRAPSRIDEPPLVDLDADRAIEPGRPRARGAMLVAAAILVVVALAGGTWAFLGTRDDSHARVLTSPAARALFDALGNSTGTGGYQVDYQFTINRAAVPGPPCPTIPEGVVVEGRTGTVRRSASQVVESGGDARATPTPSANRQRGESTSVSTVLVQGGVPRQDVTITPPCGGTSASTVTVTGRGTVHLNPYSLETTSTVTGLGEVAVRTDGSQIVEQGGGNYGKLQDGQPLPGFRSLVEGTFGQGPGALTMLGLASPTGYLSLSADAVKSVTPAGTGTVDGAPVTYYDVASDVDAMKDLPNLTDAQRTTIEESLRSLHEAGFEEATARIAIDADGYIRESTSDATFADGTTMHRHMTLSRFGCIGTGPTPANPAATDALPADCAPGTSTTTAPSTAPSTASTEPTSSTTVVEPTTITSTAPPDATTPTTGSTGLTSSTTTGP